jgi:hypothetical protein
MDAKNTSAWFGVLRRAQKADAESRGWTRKIHRRGSAYFGVLKNADAESRGRTRKISQRGSAYFGVLKKRTRNHAENIRALNANGILSVPQCWAWSSPMKRYFCLSMLALLILPAAYTQDLQVHASIGTDTVGVNDQFQLTITVSGKDSGDAEAPRLPRFQGFQVVAGPSVSTQFQWINGRTSSTKSFIYVLLPEKEGQFTIDPIEVSIGQKIYKTQPIDVRVTASSTRSAPAPSRSFSPFDDEDFGGQRTRLSEDEVFVEAELDRSSAYPGQQVTLEYHLYTQVGISGLQLQESAPLTGFWVEDLTVESNPVGTRKTVNGREYQDYVIKKQALFPTTVGKLRIPPSTFAVSARLGGSVFDFFNRNQTLYRKTKEIYLNVSTLPTDDRPATFSNAVGTFNLTDSVDKTEAATGEAIALRVKLEGKGNLKMIPDISLPSMPDFTIYSSKRSDNVKPIEGSKIGGDKTWEYVIVPKAPGDQTIPALSFSYFDPQTEAYKTVTTTPLTLKITRGQDTSGSMADLSGVSKQALTRQGTDINFIKVSADDLELRHAPVYRTMWFYLLAGIPLLGTLLTLLVERERSRRSTDGALVRSRKARRKALARLKAAQKAGRADPRRFYDEAAGAFEGYLTDKFNLPEIAVTGDSLERALAERSVGVDTIKEAIACLHECSYGRFVSASGSVEKMKQLSTRIDAVVSTLENL